MAAQEILEALDELGIDYFAFSHPPVRTMEDCCEYDKQAGVGVTHCKNLFLANRQATEFFLLLIPAAKSFKTSDVSKKLGKSRLSFGAQGRLSELLNTTPGAVSPLGLMFDRDRRVTLVIDKELGGVGKTCFHPNDNTMSLVLEMKDFLGAFLKKTGHEAVWV